MERESEERSIVKDSVRSSIHSNWSDLVPIDMEAEYRRIYKSRKRPNTTVCTATTLAAPAAEAATIPPSSPATKKTVKNILLVPHTPRPKEWGSWWVKSPYTSSTAVNQHTVHEQESDQEQKEGEIELAYQPRGPYYSPVHPLEFYEDE